jgi:F-type H+-transporting ATPase subunit b
MKSLTIILMTLMPAMLWAAEEGEHAAFNSKLFTYQCLNVGIMVIALIYFLRAGVAQYFKDKRKNYLAAAERSLQAKQAAERERAQIQEKLGKLEASVDESIARARAEAADLRQNLLAEAEGLSRRLREEANKSAHMEIERAKTHLREQIIKDSINTARAQLSTKVSPEEHQRLQGEFVHHMQGVQK